MHFCPVKHNFNTASSAALLQLIEVLAHAILLLQRHGNGAVQSPLVLLCMWAEIHLLRYFDFMKQGICDDFPHSMNAMSSAEFLA